MEEVSAVAAAFRLYFDEEDKNAHVRHSASPLQDGPMPMYSPLSLQRYNRWHGG